MKILLVLILTCMATAQHTEAYGQDAPTFYFKYAHHFWTRTSYDDASFQTNDLHLLFMPHRGRVTLDLNLYYHVEGKAELQEMLSDYSGHEQPFPYGLESLRFRIHVKSFTVRSRLMQIDTLVLGNFHRNSPRYQYLNFTRYYLHSPIDLETRRSLADWGLYSKARIWRIPFEAFLLHSLDTDHTVGFQASGYCLRSQALILSPILSGVLDRRTDTSYDLQYPLGMDKTLSAGADLGVRFEGNSLLLRPLWAYHQHEPVDAIGSSNGHLRNVAIAFTTRPFFRFPFGNLLFDRLGSARFGFRVDGIIEKNDPDYQPNFAYDRDELNDDFLQQLGGLGHFSAWQTRRRVGNTELPAFLYDREHVNVRLGESGFEIGLRLHGHGEERNTLSNVLNVGTKYARYGRTGEEHTHSYDDAWLAEIEFKDPASDLEVNAAYWKRWTNVVQDPDLEELRVSTWIIGLKYILAKRAWFYKQGYDTFDHTVFSVFFRNDHFTEKYDYESSKDRGSIFMAALQTPIFRMKVWQASLQFLYRKYVPDDYLVPRIFPPNNAIRVSVNLYGAY